MLFRSEILQAWGRLEEAFELHKKGEALCLELGNKDGLSLSYGVPRHGLSWEGAGSGAHYFVGTGTWGYGLI